MKNIGTASGHSRTLAQPNGTLTRPCAEVDTSSSSTSAGPMLKRPKPHRSNRTKGSASESGQEVVQLMSTPANSSRRPLDNVSSTRSNVSPSKAFSSSKKHGQLQRPQGKIHLASDPSIEGIVSTGSGNVSSLGHCLPETAVSESLGLLESQESEQNR
jgi:hypothetical protein